MTTVKRLAAGQRKRCLHHGITGVEPLRSLLPSHVARVNRSCASADDGGGSDGQTGDSAGGNCCSQTGACDDGGMWSLGFDFNEADRRGKTGNGSSRLRRRKHGRPRSGTGPGTARSDEGEKK